MQNLIKYRFLFTFFFVHLTYTYSFSVDSFDDMVESAKREYYHDKYKKSIEKFEFLLSKYSKTISPCQKTTIYIFLINNHLEIYENKETEWYIKKLFDREKLEFDCDTYTQGRAFHAIGWYYSNIDKVELSNHYLNKGIDILTNEPIIDSFFIASAYKVKGRNQVKNGKYKLAKNQFEIACKYASSKYKYKCYEGLGYGHFYANEYKEALFYIKKTIDETIRLFGDQHPVLIRNYTYLSGVYFDLQYYTKGIECIERALMQRKKLHREKEDFYLALIYNNLALIYASQGKHKKALFYFKESIRIENKLINHIPSLAIAKRYIRMSQSALAFGNDSSALNYCKIAQNIINKISKNKHHFRYLGMFYEAFGDYYNAISQYDSSSYYFNKAIIITKTQLERVNLPILLDKSAICELQQSNFNLALRHIQESLGQDENSSYYVNPLIKEIRFDPNKVKILQTKAQILTQYYRKETNNIKDLQAALQTYTLAIKITDTLRINFHSQASKLERSKTAASLYKEAIEVAYELLQVTNNNAYLDTAFFISEKGKAAVMQASLQEIEARQASSMPDTLAAKEKMLRDDLVYYTSQMNRISSKKNPSEFEKEQFVHYQEKYYQTKDQHEQLLRMLEKNYLDYYQLKYETGIAKLVKIKSQLSATQKVISYYEGKDHLYALIIGKDITKCIQLPADSLTHYHISTLRQSVKSSSLVTNAQRNWHAYTTSAYKLYRLLLAPLQKSLKFEDQIIIVPDGVLALIPFDILIASMPKHILQYKKLDYIINHYAISYANSATLWLKNSIKKRHIAKNQLLAFAPSFKSNQQRSFPKSREEIDTVRSMLTPLKWSKNEVSQISTYFDGIKLIGLEATESTFKKYAQDFAILHIASHANANDERPLFSKIYFTQISDSLDDAALHTFELYNLQLNADLAVLSACNTGYGKTIVGEGVINLARGFTYAGCASIVVSLWNANDRISAEIMNYFYKYLAEGHDKAHALRQAKLHYIKNAEQINTHPYFWGQFIATGDMRPLTNKRLWYWWYLVPISTIFLLLIIWYKKRNF